MKKIWAIVCSMLLAVGATYAAQPSSASDLDDLDKNQLLQANPLPTKEAELIRKFQEKEGTTLLNGELKVERHAGSVKTRRAHKVLRGIHEVAALDGRGRLGSNDRYRVMLKHGLLERGVYILA